MIEYASLIDLLWPSPDASAEESAEELKDGAEEAEEGYAKVEVTLGGRQGIERYKQQSKRLQEEVRRRLGKKEAWRQDVIIHHVGLHGLIEVGQSSIKPQFDALVRRLADQFGAKALIPAVKGPERSSVKVRVRYGGDDRSKK